MKILIIEDEAELRNSIYTFLSGDYNCETAADFNTAMEKISLYDYACIILDINLPGGSGLQILEELKANKKTDGVIMISARNALDDKVNALNIGADDYLTKPFHLSELAARLTAIIRRKSFEGNNTIQYNELTIHLDNKTVSAKGHLLDLTRKEYELLLYFISNKNKVITKNAIAEHLWGDDMYLTGNYDFIYTHIKNLRKKIMNSGCKDLIRSVYGVGYKLLN